MFSKVLNHKLFEIFFEKLLVALVLVLAGYLANQSIERYKLAEAQKMAGAAAFVEACQQVWGKIYEYESVANRQDDFDIRFRIASLANSDEKKTLPKELAKHNRLVEIELKEVVELINQKRFILGEKFSRHFFKYIGLVKARADARASMLMKFNEEAKIAQDAVDSLDRQIYSMRFSDGMAREYAISQIAD
ncbi:hypothetical protein VI06_17675 [Aquitalea magnusonii]|nr:hypothetical protein VI06_17675 [Aquitalea magnusonii]